MIDIDLGYSSQRYDLNKPQTPNYLKDSYIKRYDTSAKSSYLLFLFSINEFLDQNNTINFSEQTKSANTSGNKSLNNKFNGLTPSNEILNHTPYQQNVIYFY